MHENLVGCHAQMDPKCKRGGVEWEHLHSLDMYVDAMRL